MKITSRIVRFVQTVGLFCLLFFVCEPAYTQSWFPEETITIPVNPTGSYLEPAWDDLFIQKPTRFDLRSLGWDYVSDLQNGDMIELYASGFYDCTSTNAQTEDLCYTLGAVFVNENGDPISPGPWGWPSWVPGGIPEDFYVPYGYATSTYIQIPANAVAILFAPVHDSYSNNFTSYNFASNVTIEIKNPPLPRH